MGKSKYKNHLCQVNAGNLKTTVLPSTATFMLYLVIAAAMAATVATQTSDDSSAEEGQISPAEEQTSPAANSSTSETLASSPATSATPATGTIAEVINEATTAEPLIALMFHPIYRQLLQRGYQLLSEFSRVPVPADTMDVDKILSAIMMNVDILQVLKRSIAHDDIRLVFHKPETVNHRCYDEVIDFIDALIGQRENASSEEYITTPWALRMADAFGKPDAGLLEGTLQMIGNYDECLDVHAKISKGSFMGSRPTARNKSSEFRTRYCRTQILLPPSRPSTNDVNNSTNMPAVISWGMCLPESCEGRDVKNLMTQGALAAFSFPIFNVVCFERDRDLGSDGWAVFAVCLLSTMAAVVVVCTVVETAIYHGFLPISQENESSKNLSKNFTDTGNEKTEKKPDVPNLRTPLSVDRRPKDLFGDEEIPDKVNRHKADNKDESTPFGVRLLEAFSVRYNGKKIMAMSTSSEPGMMACLQGMRVISIWWIILGHTYCLVAANPHNFMFTSATDVDRIASRLSFTFIAGANLAVDTFFVISGLLVMKITLRELRRGKGQTVSFWVMFYLHRFWRLTPVYMMVLMTGTTLYDFFVDGPLKSRTFMIFEFCDSHWWSNLLYINNFYKNTEMCMIWTWYLAVDMQLFLVSPIFIFLIHRKYRIGILVLIATIILGCLATVLLTLDHPGMFATAMLYHNEDFLKHVYLVPWPRISVFAVGLLLGVLLEDAPETSYISKVKAFLIWVFLTGVSIFIILIVHDELKNSDDNWAKGTLAVYESMSRLVWGIYIAWIVYACENGLGGIATNFLTWMGFQPLARLTYTVYLVHALIITFFMYERNSTIDLQDTVMIYMFCGNLILSYLVAAFYTLLFEAPLLSLEKIVLKRK